MFDVDTINQIAAEERQYQKWVQQEKNRIFSLPTYEKKKAAWDKLFPKLEIDDNTVY